MRELTKKEKAWSDWNNKDRQTLNTIPKLLLEHAKRRRDRPANRHKEFGIWQPWTWSEDTNIALRYADYGYVLENGRGVMDGKGKELRENEDVKEFYLGVGGGGRKSFCDGKNYRRRKRWL